MNIPNKQPNGAEVLLNTFMANGVDTCFGNPGTSEMSFVVALDRVKGFRCILALQENIATGAADGFYRMKDRPASTLLHLGPGLSNGSSNLHNARKAGSGIVNVIGEHSNRHLEIDSPLKADLEGLTRPVSQWWAKVDGPDKVSGLAAEAIAAAGGRPAQIASLLLRGDASWSEVSPENAAPVVAQAPVRRSARPDVGDAVEALRKGGDKTLLLLGGRALRSGALELAGRIEAATGCIVGSNFGIPRIERGAGRYAIHRFPYYTDLALADYARFETIVCVQTDEPIGFFGYPSKPSKLRDPESRLIRVCGAEHDAEECLEEIAAAFPRHEARLQTQDLPGAAIGALTPETIAAVMARAIPEGAIVVDESMTTGRQTFPITAGARPHDWLQNVGGSTGYGTPVAVGTAVACPDRKIIALIGDGSFMMTPQSLWTMAREGLDVVVVVFVNRNYKILRGEVRNVGAGDTIGPVAESMLSIDRPDIDMASLARGLGVPAKTVSDAEGFAAALQGGLAEHGPMLISVECAE